MNHKWAEYSTHILKICKTVCQTIYVYMQAGQVVAVPDLIKGTMTCTCTWNKIHTLQKAPAGMC